MQTQFSGSSASSKISFPPTVLEAETCPSCGQEIPAEKLQEISGRIAARERERTQAITAELERKYEEEARVAEAEAAEKLRAQARQSEAREKQIREEMKLQTQTLIRDKVAELDRARQSEVGQLEQKIEAAEQAKRTAEELTTSLESKFAALQRTSSEALEAAEGQARKREEQAREEATRIANAAASAQIEQLRTEQKESEEKLIREVREANAAKQQARERETLLNQQLEDQKRESEAEVQRVKKDAELAAESIRAEANRAAEEKLRGEIEISAQNARESVERARTAETRLEELEKAQTELLEQQLGAQREVLEKAKEDAVNAERAKAFEETQKLSNKVNDLQRALEKKSAEELGEGAEVNIFEALKAEFPDDKITRIAKGAPGADIRHVVVSEGKECGTILYDSKNHNAFRNDHVTKLRTDQIAARAEHAILSTHKFPQGARQLHVQDGVLLANPARVVALAGIVRQHMVHVYLLRLSEVERDQKVSELYNFITSERCTGLMRRIDETAACLLDQQAKEIRWHENNWKKQGESYRAIQKAKTELESEIHSIIGTTTENPDSEEEIPW